MHRRWGKNFCGKCTYFRCSLSFFCRQTSVWGTKRSLALITNMHHCWTWKAKHIFTLNIDGAISVSLKSPNGNEGFVGLYVIFGILLLEKWWKIQNIFWFGLKISYLCNSSHSWWYTQNNLSITFTAASIKQETSGWLWIGLKNPSKILRTLTEKYTSWKGNDKKGERLFLEKIRSISLKEKSCKVIVDRWDKVSKTSWTFENH